MDDIVEVVVVDKGLVVTVDIPVVGEWVGLVMDILQLVGIDLQVEVGTDLFAEGTDLKAVVGTEVQMVGTDQFVKGTELQVLDTDLLEEGNDLLEVGIDLLEVGTGLLEVGIGLLEVIELDKVEKLQEDTCLLYTSPSPRDRTRSRMPSSA